MINNSKILSLYKLLSVILLFCIPIEPLIGKVYYFFKIIYIIFFLFINICWSKKNKKLNKYNVIFFTFIIYSIFSIIYSGHKQSSISMGVELLINFLISLGVAFNIRIQDNDEKAIIIIRKLMDAFVLGVFVITLYLLIFNLPYLGRWERLGQTLYLNYGSYMVYSYCEIISITYLIWNIFFSDINIKNNKFKIIILITQIIGALVSGTRKSLLCPIIFLFIYIVFKYKKKIFKLLFYLIISLVFIFIGYKIMMSNTTLYNRIGIRIESMVQSITQKTTEEGSINERTLLRSLSMKAFKENPIIGYGLHAFRYYSLNNSGPFLYAHCNYTEILADLGIIGFSLYYISYIFLLYLAFKNRKSKKLSLIIIAFLLMNLIADYSTVSYYRHYYLIIYFIFSAYLNIPNYNK